MSWDADVLRGGRGVVSTTELDAASRVFDRASVESSWRDGDWALAAGLVDENVRGYGLREIDAAGPVARARGSGAIGGVGTYVVTAESGTLSGATLPAFSYGRADTGVLLASRLGPVGADVEVRGGADVASNELGDGYDAVGSARARLALPLERSFDVDDGKNDSWRHRVEPEVEGGAFALQGSGLAGDIPSPGGVEGMAWVVDGGARTSLGRWGGRTSLEVGGDAGAVGGARQSLAAVARWRAAVSDGVLALGAEGADVGGPAGGLGHAVVVRGRIGAPRSLSLALSVAGREGVDPVVARALTDSVASSSGFLATSGWTASARGSLPITKFVMARAGADGDLSADKLVGVHGSLEVHDRCACVAVRLTASERLGRDGVDVWMAVDLAPGSR